MHVAVTNDDGYDSPGLAALRAALLDQGVRVTVVAPDGNRSAMGHSVTCREPITVQRERAEDEDNPIYSSSGRPADCARLAVLAEGLWPAVDVVVSGINIGVNTGDDINYSGTFAAAAEAALLGVPSIAFSQQPETGGAPFINHSAHQYRYAGYAAQLVRSLGKLGAPARATINVNLPHAAIDATPVVTSLGRRYFNSRVPGVPVSDSSWEFRPYASRDFPEPAYDVSPETDFGALVSGRISVTPVDLGRRGSEDLRAWVHDVIGGAGPPLSR